MRPQRGRVRRSSRVKRGHERVAFLHGDVRPRVLLREGDLLDVIDEVGVPLVELREGARDVVSVSCHDPFLFIKMLSVYYGLFHVPANAEGVPGSAEGVPGNAEGVPASAEGVPRNAGGVPASAGGVPENAEGVPGSAGHVPGSAERVPGSAEGVPGGAGHVPGKVTVSFKTNAHSPLTRLCLCG